MSQIKNWSELEEKLKKEMVPYKISDCGEFGIFQFLVYKGASGSTEWWAQEDWDEHAKEVKRLKKAGEYLKPEIVTITIKRSPEDYGELVSIADAKESHSLDIIDLSKIRLKL